MLFDLFCLCGIKYLSLLRNDVNFRINKCYTQSANVVTDENILINQPKETVLSITEEVNELSFDSRSKYSDGSL